MRLKLVVAAVALCTIGVAGCGDDDDSASSVDEYCQLVAELDDAGNELFEGLDENATEEDFAAAFAAFVEEHESDLDRLEDIAPEEIRDDVATLLAVQREIAETGDLSALETDELAEADERLTEFEEENCPDAEE